MFSASLALVHLKGEPNAHQSVERPRKPPQIAIVGVVVVVVVIVYSDAGFPSAAPYGCCYGLCWLRAL